MDLDQLRAFALVASRGQITEAAKELGISQPTLSRRLQGLEREVGTELLVRGADGVHPTAAGARFLAHATRAVGALTAAVRELEEEAQTPRGVVSVGSTHSAGAYALPDLLARYHARYPVVRLRLREGSPEELEAWLARGEIDLAIQHLPVRRGELRTRKLWQEDYVLALPPNHRLAKVGRAVALSEIAGEPMVVVPNVPAARALEAAAEEAGVRPKVAVEADHLETVRRMVARGFGVALLPRLVARASALEVALLELSSGGLKRQMALVHRGNAYLSAAARALKAMIVRELSGGPPPGT